MTASSIRTAAANRRLIGAPTGRASCRSCKVVDDGGPVNRTMDPARCPMNTPKGVKHWEGPGLDAWHPWTPAQVAAELTGVNVPWCVVGGWAIDLWLGERTRDHEDIEIAVPRYSFG